MDILKLDLDCLNTKVFNINTIANPETKTMTFVRKKDRSYTVMWSCSCGRGLIESFNNTPAIRLSQHRAKLKKLQRTNDFYRHILDNNHKFSEVYHIIREYPVHQSIKDLRQITDFHIKQMKEEESSESKTQLGADPA
jgi:hypothetical protein